MHNTQPALPAYGSGLGLPALPKLEGEDWGSVAGRDCPRAGGVPHTEIYITAFSRSMYDTRSIYIYLKSVGFSDNGLGRAAGRHTVGVLDHVFGFFLVEKEGGEKGLK